MADSRLSVGVKSSIKVECVITEKNEFGKSPVWDEKDSVFGGSAGGVLSLVMRRVSLQKPVGSVVRKADGYVIEEGMCFAFVDRVMHSITTAAQLDKEKANARFSDGKVKQLGGSLQTCRRPWWRGNRGLCILTVHHSDQVDISDSLDWSLDHRIFFPHQHPAVHDYHIQTGCPYCIYFSVCVCVCVIKLTAEGFTG
ncbi:regucalcin-like [Triplophysa rosa]|uniref:regucalcin-like n=1 Tax=Triplophysa rosa TaxID=992332 RepID=UPI0025462F1E|nr:regucalcin-like [Triplophysa rosa]